MKELFKPADAKLYFKRHDLADPRLGERVRVSESSGSVVVAGYPDDEGIGLNGGRQGASGGPDAIRKFLYKMTLPERFPEIADLGNLNLARPLSDRHEQVAQEIDAYLKQDAQNLWIGLGGGHDYGYADGAGFLRAQQGLKPLIINFDAHLDVRSLERGLTSGTPFFRLLNEFPQQFEFFQIGIQSQCNSAAHFQWAVERGASVLRQEEALLSGRPFGEWVMSHLAESVVRSRPCYLSVDIDVFATAFAPGCSQSWPMGITPQDFFPLLEILVQRLNVRVLGIYEVAPNLDVADMTAKLAAQIVYRVLKARSK